MKEVCSLQEGRVLAWFAVVVAGLWLFVVSLRFVGGAKADKEAPKTNDDASEKEERGLVLILRLLLSQTLLAPVVFGLLFPTACYHQDRGNEGEELDPLLYQLPGEALALPLLTAYLVTAQLLSMDRVVEQEEK